MLCNCADEASTHDCKTVTCYNTGNVESTTCMIADTCAIRKKMSVAAKGAIGRVVFEGQQLPVGLAERGEEGEEYQYRTLRAYNSPVPNPSTFYVTAKMTGGEEACAGSVKDVLSENADCFEKCLLVNALAGYGFVGSKSIFNLVERNINPLLVLDRNGRVQHMNASAKELLTGEYGLSISGGGKLTGLTASMKETLGNLLKAVFIEERPVASRPVRNEEDGQCDLVMLYRLSSEHNSQNVWAWFFERESLALMAVRRVTAKQELCVELVGEAFTLTPKEARLTAALCGGFTLDEYAEKEGVSKETVRWHLRQVLQKTNTRSQTDLVRLVLYGMSFPGVF